MIRSSDDYQAYIHKERRTGRLNDKYFQTMNYEYSTKGKVH